MPKYLILKLEGPMQAWGTHTYEDYRPSNLFPTRSGLLGLIAACLGIERADREAQQRLATSIEFTVRADDPARRDLKMVRLQDYHTVQNARRANRPPKMGETILTWREYLYDARFTVAVGGTPDAEISLDLVAEALARPRFTPVLGRRSCPLARPLFEGWIEAEDAKMALNSVAPRAGTIYSEAGDHANEQRMRLRDVPMHGDHRRF